MVTYSCVENKTTSLKPSPTKIEKHGEHDMLLAWTTGEEYAVPFFEMRFACPCAACVDEHTGERVLERSSIRADIRPSQVEAVGRYAITISWNDSHRTGIYHFDRLWDLCSKAGRRLS